MGRGCGGNDVRARRQSDTRPDQGDLSIVPPRPAYDDPILSALLWGLDLGVAAICVCDENDHVRFMNEIFRAAFLPAFGGEPVEFTRALTDAIRSGQGIRLQSLSPSDFEAHIRRRRHDQVGALSFAADTVDGRWWSVTDAKLPNGWMVAIAKDISGLKEEEFRLRAAHASAIEEALTDFLTGIPNRRHGLREGESLFDECRALGQGMTVALLDMDHFKTINDAYGHSIGDKVLIDFAQSLTRLIGASERLSRIGGEEFLLVSAQTDPARFEALLSSSLAALRPVDLGAGGCLRYTVSVGYASMTADDCWQRLLRRADVALYRAKARGRDRIESAVA